MKKSTQLPTNTPGADCKGTRLSLLTSTAILGATFLVVAGCSTPRESHRVSAPPPTAPTRDVAREPAEVVVTRTAQSGENVQYVTTFEVTPATRLIIVNQAPPAPPPEAVIAQPTQNHVWIPGFWTWRNERYEWMAGHWEVPPRSSSEWVNPRWENDGNAYRFFEGYWD